MKKGMNIIDRIQATHMAQMQNDRLSPGPETDGVWNPGS